MADIYATRYMVPENSQAARDEASAACAQALVDRDVKLLQVIEALKDHIQHEDVAWRAKSLAFLRDVLTNVNKLDPNFLTRHDISLLVTFFCGRVDATTDVAIAESLAALITLTNCTKFTQMKEEALKIVETVFATASHSPDEFAALPANSRLAYMEVVYGVTQCVPEKMIRMGDDFVKGVLALNLKEGRPQNLSIWFGLATFTLANLEIEDFVDELWEALSRYFPITFPAIRNIVGEISPDDLKAQLRGCIAGSTYFTSRAVPFLLEKLDVQTTASVKKDVILTLAACLQQGMQQDIEPVSLSIWAALKWEIYNSNETEVRLAATEAVGGMFVTLSRGLDVSVETASHPLLPLLSEITSELNEHIQRSKQEDSAKRVIRVLCRSSPAAFQLVVKLVLPQIIRTHQTPRTPNSTKQLLLDIINTFLECMEWASTEAKHNYGQLISLESARSPGSLTAYLSEIFTFYKAAIGDAEAPERALIAVTGFMSMVNIDNFLGDQYVEKVLELFRVVLVRRTNLTPPTEALRIHIIQCIRKIAKKSLRYTEQVDEAICQPLAAEVPAKYEAPSTEATRHSLDCLARIGLEGQLFFNFHKMIIQKSDMSSALREEFLAAILLNLQEHSRLDNLSSSENPDQDYYEEILKNLFKMELEVMYHSDGQPYIHFRKINDETSLSIIGQIATLAVRCDQKAGWSHRAGRHWPRESLFTLFLAPPLPGQDDPQQMNRLYAENGMFRNEECAFLLTSGLLAGLDPKCDLEIDVTRAACAMINMYFDDSSTHSDHTYKAQRAFVSLLVNKWNASAPSRDSLYDQLPHNVLEKRFHTHFHLSTDPKQQEGAVSMMFACAVAMLMKLDQGALEILRILIEAVGQEGEKAKIVARGFIHLLPDSDVLCKENFATIRKLYKHRGFDFCRQMLVGKYTKYKTSGSPIRDNYLVAILGILKNCPRQILESLPEDQLDAFLPIILQSLTNRANTQQSNVASAESVKSVPVSMLNFLMSARTAVVSEHLHTLVGGLLCLATDREYDNVLRRRVLEALQSMPRTFKAPQLLPFRNRVMMALDGILGDASRRIRVTAAAARLAWFSMVRPGEDEE